MKISEYIYGRAIKDVGGPIEDEYQEALSYCEGKYAVSKEYIKSLVEGLNLYDKNIVSIASGYGAEEALFSQLGNNFVDCIEPDDLTRRVCNEFLEKLNVKNVKVYDEKIQSYNVNKKYDLIYSNSPSDWMHSDFRQIVPKRYIDFFNKYGNSKAVIITVVRGGVYDRFIINSSWFLQSLIKVLKENTGYTLMRYWIYKNRKVNTNRRMSIFLASNYNVSPLFEIPGYDLKYDVNCCQRYFMNSGISFILLTLIRTVKAGAKIILRKKFC